MFLLKPLKGYPQKDTPKMEQQSIYGVMPCSKTAKGSAHPRELSDCQTSRGLRTLSPCNGGYFIVVKIHLFCRSTAKTALQHQRCATLSLPERAPCAPLSLGPQQHPATAPPRSILLITEPHSQPRNSESRPEAVQQPRSGARLEF